MEKVVFKKDFVERYSNLTDFKEFKEINLKLLPRTIRVNTLKTTRTELKKRLKDWNLKPLKFYKNGFVIEHKRKERRDIGNIKEHFLGHFYVQEAASMIPPLVLNPTKDDIVLDVAAAPGSKTTQMAMMMGNKGLIVANEYKYARVPPLSINLQRCGVSNTVVVLGHGERIKGSYKKI